MADFDVPGAGQEEDVTLPRGIQEGGIIITARLK